MNHRFAQLFLFVLLLGTFSSCKKDCHEEPPITPPIDTTQTNPCDTLLPVVFLHGSLASGDTWANQVMRFTSNTYCGELLFAYDWNSIGGGSDVAALDVFIDTVLARTGKAKVNLVGHSAGGGYGYSYCDDAARALKVAHYVHIGSSSQSQAAGPNGEIPTMNISSPDDAVAGQTNITGAQDVVLSGQDHYQVATSTEAFDAMYRFFNNGAVPQTLAVTPQSPNVAVAGKGVTLGENAPLNGAAVNIYELNAATGGRLQPSPSYTATTNERGEWGPVTVKANTKYEFEIVSANSSDRVIHYYREGFTHNNPLVYLRIIPPASSTAGLLLSGLSSNDNQTVLAVFAANQAVIAGRDSLTVDNVVLSTQAYTPASNTVIAMFLYDANNNQQSDFNVPGLFGILNVFLTARDMYFATTPAGSIPLRFNGRDMSVPNLPSASEGVIVVVFD